MLCLLLHLILPKGKEPFNPISLLGFHSAWQHTPASTCVFQEPSLLPDPFPCCSQLIICLPAHLCGRASLSCPSTSQQPSFKDVRRRHEISLARAQGWLTVQEAAHSVAPEQQGWKAPGMGCEGFAPTAPNSGWSVDFQLSSSSLWNSSTHFARSCTTTCFWPGNALFITLSVLELQKQLLMARIAVNQGFQGALNKKKQSMHLFFLPLCEASSTETPSKRDRSS